MLRNQLRLNIPLSISSSLGAHICLSLFLTILFFQVPVFGQYTQVANFDNYNVENGLSHDYTHAIAQDQHGFIWIGTQYGLQRFDGYKFTNFLHNPADSNSIASNYISFLEVEADGKLLIGFYDIAAIDRFDPATGKFAHQEISDHAQHLGLCRNGDMWLGNGDQFWREVKGNEKTTFHSYPPHPKHSLYIGPWVMDIFEDKKQTVWSGTQRGLYKVGKNDTPGEWWVPCDDQYFSADTTFFVNQIIEGPKGKLWLATEKGLFVKSDSATCLVPFRTVKNDAFPFENQNITSIALDPKGQLWICTETNGIYHLHPGNDEVQHVLPHSINLVKAELPVLDKLFVDQQGTVWMLSLNHGLLSSYESVF